MHWAKRLNIGCVYKFQIKKNCKNGINIFRGKNTILTGMIAAIFLLIMSKMAAKH